jgi:hypothetical protein
MKYLKTLNINFNDWELFNINYLISEYIIDSFNYVNINQNPRYHYNHIFFTNGNGIDFINGNPHVFVHNQNVLWSDYYDRYIDFNKIKSDKLFNIKDICDDKYNYYKKFNLNISYETICDNNRKLINNIQNLKLKDILSKNFWLSTFNYKSYWPFLQLSDGFFDLQKLNKNTEITLLKVAISLTEAYIDFYNSKPIINKYRPIFGTWNDENINRCFHTMERDKRILIKELDRLYNLLNF